MADPKINEEAERLVQLRDEFRCADTIHLLSPAGSNRRTRATLRERAWSALSDAIDALAAAKRDPAAAVPAVAQGEAVADWNNRRTDTFDGWINELLTLAQHREPIPGFARDAMRTIARGLATTHPATPASAIAASQPEEVTILAAEGEARDAARYRWLRDGRNTEGPSMVAIYATSQLDEVIDAALATSQAASGAEGGEQSR